MRQNKILIAILGLVVLLSASGCRMSESYKLAAEVNNQVYAAFNENDEEKEDGEIVEQDVQVVAAPAAPAEEETSQVQIEDNTQIETSAPVETEAPTVVETEPQTEAPVETEAPVVETPAPEPVTEAPVQQRTAEAEALYSQGFNLSCQYSSLINDVYNRTNEVRAQAGTYALSLDSELTSIACARAYEIATNNYFSHTRPDGRTCFTILDDYGVAYMCAGENLAYGQTSPEEVVNAWVNSQGHYSTMIGGYNKIGVGVCVASDGTIYWVQIFTD